MSRTTHPKATGGARTLALASMPVLATLGLAGPAAVLGKIGVDLHVPFGATGWIVVAYTLALGLATPVAGKTLDVRGSRAVIAAGLGAIAAGTILVLVATTLIPVIVGRVLQGLGTSAMSTAAFAALGSSTGVEPRLRVISRLTAGSCLALGTAPVVGSLVTSAGGWRLTLALPLLPCFAAMFALRAAPPGNRAARSVDPAGGALLGIALLAALTGAQARASGLPTWSIGPLLAISGTAAIGLRSHLRRHPDAFLPRSLIRDRSLRGELVAAAALNGGCLAMQLLAPRALGSIHPLWSTLHAGLSLMPAGILAGAVALAIRPLARGPVAPVLGALGLTSAAAMAAASIAPGTASATLADAVAIAGFAGAQIVLIGRIADRVAPSDVGIATGTVTMSTLTGGATGAAAGAALLAATSPASSLLIAAALTGLGTAAGLIIAVRGRPTLV